MAKVDASVVFEDYSIDQGVTAGVLESSSVPFWGDSPESWNTVIIGGIRIPGIASISGKAFEVRADKKSIPGEHGEKMTTLGREPCDPEITLKLWTPQQLKDFLTIVKLFLPKSHRQLPPPVDVIHPALAIFKVRSLRIMSCTFPEEKEKDVFELKLKCREFVRGTGTKPKTDKASIEKEGPGAVLSRLFSFLSPDKTNGNAPRTRGGGGATGSF